MTEAKGKYHEEAYFMDSNMNIYSTLFGTFQALRK